MKFRQKFLGGGGEARTEAGGASVPPPVSPELYKLLERCRDVYAGHPDWAGRDGIRTVNFAKTVCSETARLATLGVSARVAGEGERAAFLDRAVASLLPELRAAVEYACAFGTVIVKPNGPGLDIVLPDRFMVTHTEGPFGRGRITGVAFFDRRRGGGGDGDVFTRVEHHRLRGGVWRVKNYVVRRGERVPITASPFAGLAGEALIAGGSCPLFSVLRTPEANNIDAGSPLGLPIFAGALEELADLDVAYSRLAREIYDSRRCVLLDSDRLFPSGPRGRGAALDAMGLPDYVRAVFGTGSDDIYHEIDPALHTTERVAGIDMLLDSIARKCGFSGGYFTHDARRGLLTATQVEADDRRTVGTIRDVRSSVESCLYGLVAALSELADATGVPRGEGELICNFGDITYSRDEDRARWYGYVRDGYVGFEEYMKRFEGEAGAWK